MKRIFTVQELTKLQGRYFTVILILLPMSLVSIIVANFIDVEPGFWGTKKGTLIMIIFGGYGAAISLIIDLITFITVGEYTMSNKIHYRNYRELRERGRKEKGKIFLYEFINQLNTRGYMNKKPPSLITGLKQKIALLSEKTNHQIVKQYVCISNNEHLRTMGAVALVAMLFVPEAAFAADPKDNDAFLAIFNKLAGWITGSAGKLITVIAIAVAAFIGVLGFSMKYVLGSFGVGLLLAFSVSIVNMLFAA